ncbi:DUF560 domain-containing protein [Salmonella enterica]|nr:DUF560 domain-containing protein [Salmonella enterica]
MLSEAALRQRPGIVIQGLTQSLIKGDVAGVRLFLPLYQQSWDGRADVLNIWAEALLARVEGRYDAAIAGYRKLISDYPELHVIRFQLAVTLFENQDNDNALQQFQRLRSTLLPSGLNAQTEAYIRRIQARESWSVSVALSYLDERNINNAPPRGTRIGRWQAGKPESGRGVEYGLNATKTWSYGEGLFSEYDFSGYAEQYLNNHKYDRFILKNKVGGGYRNVSTSLQVQPFIEQHFEGGGQSRADEGVRYTLSVPGVDAEGRFYLSPHWRLDTDVEYGVKTYRGRHDLDGYRFLVSGSVYYFLSPEQYVWGGLSHRTENAKSESNAYRMNGVRAGWGYDWQHGISWRLQGGYRYREYGGPDFFGIRQKVNEYSTMVTVWNRDWYFLGVTPKLSWIYTRADSNHPFYDIEKSRVVWSLGRDF